MKNIIFLALMATFAVTANSAFAGYCVGTHGTTTTWTGSGTPPFAWGETRSCADITATDANAYATCMAITDSLSGSSPACSWTGPLPSGIGTSSLSSGCCLSTGATTGATYAGGPSCSGMTSAFSCISNGINGCFWGTSSCGRDTTSTCPAPNVMYPIPNIPGPPLLNSIKDCMPPNVGTLIMDPTGNKCCRPAPSPSPSPSPSCLAPNSWYPSPHTTFPILNGTAADCTGSPNYGTWFAWGATPPPPGFEGTKGKCCMVARDTGGGCCGPSAIEISSHIPVPLATAIAHCTIRPGTSTGCPMPNEPSNNECQLYPAGSAQCSLKASPSPSPSAVCPNGMTPKWPPGSVSSNQVNCAEVGGTWYGTPPPGICCSRTSVIGTTGVGTVNTRPTPTANPAVIRPANTGVVGPSSVVPSP